MRAFFRPFCFQLSNSFDWKARSRNWQLWRLVARATIYRNCCARIELRAIINGKARANHVVQCEFVKNGGKCSMLSRGTERTAKLSVISKGEVRTSCEWDGTIDDSGEAECNRARDEARPTKTQRDRNMTNARQQPRCGQSAHGHRSKLTFSYIHSPKFPVFSFRFIDTPRITKFGTRTIATQFTTRRPLDPVSRVSMWWHLCLLEKKTENHRYPGSLPFYNPANSTFTFC